MNNSILNALIFSRPQLPPTSHYKRAAKFCIGAWSWQWTAFRRVKRSFCAAIVNLWSVSASASDALCDLLIELNALLNTRNLIFHSLVSNTISRIRFTRAKNACLYIANLSLFKTAFKFVFSSLPFRLYIRIMCSFIATSITFFHFFSSMGV